LGPGRPYPPVSSSEPGRLHMFIINQHCAALHCTAMHSAAGLRVCELALAFACGGFSGQVNPAKAQKVRLYELYEWRGVVGLQLQLQLAGERVDGWVGDTQLWFRKFRYSSRRSFFLFRSLVRRFFTETDSDLPPAVMMISEIGRDGGVEGCVFDRD